MGLNVYLPITIEYAMLVRVTYYELVDGFLRVRSCLELESW